ncbi:MAG TPA: N-acetylmuramoyl-L-alanine amidase [Terriglobales bacterium]|nr:N-acetylmuramoyl-L-alanine amidase [Terriglobales bacterium]
MLGLCLTLLSTFPVFGRNVARAKEIARAQFETAAKMREALNGTPEGDRTRRDYQRVTDAYRRVYYLAPTSTKADAAVVAVAELLAETGREFNDAKMLQAAIGQYEFLRREYPGSKYRVDALFTIGQIYQEDLGNSAQAKATFQEFLKHYPHSHLADEARKAIVEANTPSERKNGRVKESARAEKTEAAPKIEKPERDVAELTDKDARSERADKRSSAALVTGIRHWSTPDYTRVAIDLESEVKYEAGRIANPDRIFFDLHDTRLASTLVGKTFDVQDGFLRKVRVAQFQRGLTRVVLDVADVSDYSVFLLPNPYRLIIDIHGKPAKKPQSILAKKQAADADHQIVATANNENQTQEKDEASAPLTANAARPAEAGLKKPEPKPDKPAIKAAEKKVAELEKSVNASEGEPKAEDTAIAAAKSTQSELKATSKPTSEPTFESVAPRDSQPGKTTRRKRQSTPDVLAREARPTSNGERSLIRALGLKIGKIVVDAGHGGHDTGTIGPNGLQEKDLVLDVSLRLGKLLQKQMGADVVYTRDDDTFIPLETRTAIANQHQSDLFISIHANSSNDPAARGVETYYLNFTSSPDALDVAARENAVSEKSIHELQDLVKKITLKEKIDESREFAADVQKSLYGGIAAKAPAVRNRGVKKAPFIVLIGANMPSILAEISFLSNPTDERRLQTPEYRQKIAEYLYKGVERYVSGLSGIKVARTTTRSAASARGPRQISEDDQ